MNNTAIIRKLACTTSILAALAAAHVQADNYSETLVTSSQHLATETVSFADLDLSSAEGQEALHWRLASAAREVCGSTDVRITASVRQAAENRECSERALNDALSQVSAGRLAATN